MSVKISSSFFFNDTATTEIYTLSLHDALPIWQDRQAGQRRDCGALWGYGGADHSLHGADGERPGFSAADGAMQAVVSTTVSRSEEHTSELQSPDHLLCRLLPAKKKKIAGSAGS